MPPQLGTIGRLKSFVEVHPEDLENHRRVLCDDLGMPSDAQQTSRSTAVDMVGAQGTWELVPHPELTLARGHGAHETLPPELLVERAEDVLLLRQQSRLLRLVSATGSPESEELVQQDLAVFGRRTCLQSPVETLGVGSVLVRYERHVCCTRLCSLLIRQQGDSLIQFHDEPFYGCGWLLTRY